MKMFLLSKLKWIILLATIAACSTNFKNTAYLVEAQKYKEAKAKASHKNKTALELAALLLAHEAISNKDKTLENLYLLNQGSKAGKRALKYLEKNQDYPVASMAKVLLASKRPSKKIRVFLTSDYSDLRAVVAHKYASRFEDSALEEMLNDFDYRVRAAAVKNLCLNKNTDKNEFFKLIKRDPHFKVRSSLGYCIHNSHNISIKDYFDFVKNEKNKTIQIHLLGHLKAQLSDDEVIKRLLLFSSGKPTVSKIEAAILLSAQKTEEAQSRIKDALENNDPSIRKAALLAVCKVAFSDATKIYLEKLDDEPLVSMEAARLLLSSHPIEAIKRLKEIKNTNYSFSKQASALLAQKGDEEIIIELKEEFTSIGGKTLVNWIRNYQKVPTFTDLWISLLGNSNSDVRVEAAKALLAMSN